MFSTVRCHTACVHSHLDAMLLAIYKLVRTDGGFSESGRLLPSFVQDDEPCSPSSAFLLDCVADCHFACHFCVLRAGCTGTSLTNPLTVTHHRTLCSDSLFCVDYNITCIYFYVIRTEMCHIQTWCFSYACCSMCFTRLDTSRSSLYKHFTIHHVLS